ncbi:hypothetical protein, partial [uncultured Microscilla sp.]|uniref:hypothetical protein n=1 Tax=uncultured Microscilla sp. TaxID=432653 RepID=UPI0026059CBF
SATELAKFHTKRLKVSKDDFILSLQGNFRCEHLFTLKQALQTYDFIGLSNGFKTLHFQCRTLVLRKNLL